MNEHKIRLIADQATEWCQQNAHGSPTAWEWEYKFAELIVKECLDIIEKDNPQNIINTFYSNDLDYGVDRGWLMATETKTNQIKKHFGVE